jgi:hypothetical protein
MGLEINTNQTKLLIHSRREDKPIPRITLTWETIDAVKDFSYLGIYEYQSTTVCKENEIQRIISLANRVYFSLLPVIDLE